MACEWSDKIFSVTSKDFEHLALEVFQYQYGENLIYRGYTDALKINPASVKTLMDIPFLPISFFKSHNVVSGDFLPQAVFESSGTTTTLQSRHFIKDLEMYEQSFIRTFESIYGLIQDWCILGLLPSYLERSHSSLVYMVNTMIQRGKHPDSGFYLHERDKLAEKLKDLKKSGQKTLLIGVSFALLDLAYEYPQNLDGITIMETGGMKGRKREMIREELHGVLKSAFGVDSIHSEYGMTELLSQAYAKKEGLFESPPWMKVLVRDEEDPLMIQSINSTAKRGAINIIDLANVHSCSFIATDDAGLLHPDGRFEVLGRMDNTDLRGCSLMSPGVSAQG